MTAFKESGSIEYSADVLLGLQLKGMGTEGFDIDQAKQGPTREVELKILKNRNGPVGGIIYFEYSPKINYFTVDERDLPFKSGDMLTEWITGHFPAIMQKDVSPEGGAPLAKGTSLKKGKK